MIFLLYVSKCYLSACRSRAYHPIQFLRLAKVAHGIVNYLMIRVKCFDDSTTDRNFQYL